MKYLFTLSFLFCGMLAFAQLDNPNQSEQGKAIEREDRGIERESSGSLGTGMKIEREFSFNKKPKLFLGQPDAPTLERENKEKPIDINPKEEYVQRTVKFNPGYMKEFESGDGEVYKEFSKPQDLGKFHTSGEYITVSWRDAQVVDGDRVDIIVNGEVVVHNVTLLARFNSLRIDLDQGFTKIEFQALNQGESGPNTAEFKVEEADGTILTHDEWNLTTGVKASLVVIKN